MTSRAHSSSFFSFPCRRDSPRIRFSWGDFTVHHSSNTPLRVRPREMSGAFLPRQRRGFFSRGGIFGSRPLERKTWTQKFTPEIGCRCRVLRSRDARHHRGERARDRARDRPRLSECPTDRPRRLGDAPSVRVRRERPRAGGGASPRASRPPFLDALARTSWCVRSEGARARVEVKVLRTSTRVCRDGAREARVEATTGASDVGSRVFWTRAGERMARRARARVMLGRDRACG